MKVNVVKEGVKYGIICGLLSLLLMYGSWTMGLDTFVSVQFISAFVPYMIIILLIAVFQLRKKNNGIMPFAEGLKFSFLSYVVAAVLVAIGTYILFNFIDKDLTEKTLQVSLQKTKAFMERMGASPEEIQKAMDKQDPKKQDTGLGRILLGMGLGLIWDFVKSLLITLVVKKEEKFDM